jgi:hypothetical protein
MNTTIFTVLTPEEMRGVLQNPDLRRDYVEALGLFSDWLHEFAVVNDGQFLDETSIQEHLQTIIETQPFIAGNLAQNKAIVSNLLEKHAYPELRQFMQELVHFYAMLRDEDLSQHFPKPIEKS